jgi:Excreted virulence factor EspC, type VII ESX diderm
MNAVMTVDLSELDAWSTQVQRASDDLSGIARNGGHALVQTDFGPILETMMGAYNALLPSIHQSLEDNGTGMRDHAEALRATARDFTLTEDGVVRRHHANGVDARDGSSQFFDVADTTVRRAAPTETSLPQINLGFPYDTVCDLVRMLTGFDIRAELAEKIGGDVVSASSQGSSFGALGQSMKGVATNLESGSRTISKTWQGGASDAAISQIGTWVGSLDTQAGQLVQMGQNVVQICRDAWQTALAVVQCVKSAVQTVSSALATMSIPGVGWARVVQAVWQAFQAVMKAYQAIMKLIDILKQVKSFIETVKHFFDEDSAPVSTPTAPTSTGTPSSVTRDPGSITTPTIGQRPAQVTVVPA